MRKIILLVAALAAMAGLALAVTPASASPVTLPASEPQFVNGALGGVPQAARHGQTLTVNGTGYTVGETVQVGIYDPNGHNLFILGSAVVDVTGAFTLVTAPLPSSAVYRGQPSDVLSAGASASGTRYLRSSLYVT
jgi:hypothetical protein